MRPVAVVLGASTGVGAEIAIALNRNGYEVYGFHRGNNPKDASLVESILSPPSCLFTGDAGKGQWSVIQCINLLKDCVLGQRQISVLVHSLAGAAIGRAIALSERQVDRTFNNLAHSFLYWVSILHERKMLQPGARIMALSNPLPDFYLRNTGVIGAAKAALENYVKQLAIETEDHYVINAVRFGTVITKALSIVLDHGSVAHLVGLHEKINRSEIIQDEGQIGSLIVQLLNIPGYASGTVIDATDGGPYRLLDFAFHQAQVKRT